MRHLPAVRHGPKPPKRRGALPYPWDVAEAPVSLSFAEFLASEQASESRHEYVLGWTYAMAGGSERHDILSTLIAAALIPAAHATGCRAFTGNRLVKTRSGAGYYPDFMVACASAPDVQHETDPALLVEVLSHSTHTVDRREKAVAYLASPTLELLLLVSQSERRIEIGRRSDQHPFVQWDVVGPGGIVRTRFGLLDVDVLYDELDRLATTPG